LQSDSRQERSSTAFPVQAANILKRHGPAPAPEKEKKAWLDFIRSHTEVLAAVDFFTAEVWTAGGFITYYVRRIGERLLRLVR
jgi:hypothetical protein